MTPSNHTTGQRSGKADDFRPDINGLRAISVIVVVLFHFGTPGFSGGFIGVDVFFVISGFLMTKIIVSKLETNRFSIFDFLLARARRIFPALAMLCVVLLVFGWFAIDPMAYRGLAKHAASSLVFLSNITFWQEAGYFDSASKEKWLLHTWSLSVEWQFYILLPIALALVWKMFGTRQAIVLAMVLAFVGSLAVSAVGTTVRPMAAYFLLPTRAWEMMAGGLVYFYCMHVTPSQKLGKVLGWIGVAMIVIGVAVIDSRDPWPGYLALVPVVGAVLVIFARQTSSLITCNPLLAFLGDTSYSVYLWHWPVVVIFYLNGITASIPWVALGAAISILLGYLSFRFVETPVRQLRVSDAKLKEVCAYAATAGVVIGVAIVVYRAQGVPSRLNDGEAMYTAVSEAAGDWGHPGNNCDEQLYVVRCLSKGTRPELVMFIGDSLAEQWYPRYGEERVGRLSSTIFLTKGACLPIRGIDSSNQTSNCAEFAEMAWKEVLDRKPNKLIIASIWLTYFFDADSNRRTGVCLKQESGCDPVTDNQRIGEVFNRLIPDIRRAVDAGTKVFILAPTPQSGVDYPKMKLAEVVAHHLPLSVVSAPEQGMVRDTFPVDGKRYSQSLIVDFLANLANQTNVTLIMPEQYLCPVGVCRNVDSQGRPIYRDRGHLRRSYVQSGAVAWLDKLIGVEP